MMVRASPEVVDEAAGPVELGRPAAETTSRRPSPRRRGPLLAAIVAFTLLWSLLPTPSPFDAGTVATWIAGMATYVAVAGAQPVGGGVHARVLTPERVPRAQRRSLTVHVALLIAVLAAATAARFVALEDVPPIVHSDEGESALMGLAIALGRPDAPSFFGTGWLSHPTPHFYFEALSIKAFGVTLFAARLVSAAWGVVAVAATYAAGRALVNRRTGLVAAALAATAPVALQLSRYSLDNVETVALGCASITLFAAALRQFDGSPCPPPPPPAASRGTPLLFALAGTCAGLALYFYEGSWATLAILALLWGLVSLRHPRRWQEASLGGAVALGGLLVAALPLLVFLVRHPEASGASRAFGELFVPAHLIEMERQAHAPGALAFFLGQLELSLGQFFVVPDASGFYPFGGPILIEPVAGLLAGGLALALATIRTPASRVLLTWFGVTLVAGNVLFGLAPYTPRIVGALPAVFVLAAAALDWFLLHLADVAPWGKRAGVVAASALVLAIAATSIHDYFDGYFQRSPAQVTSSLLRFIATLPPGTHVYSLAKDFGIAGPHERYVGYRVTFEDVQDPATSVSDLRLQGSETVFVLFPPYLDLLPAIEHRFHGGAARAIAGPDGQVAFATYVVRCRDGPLSACGISPPLGGEMPQAESGPSRQR